MTSVKYVCCFLELEDRTRWIHLPDYSAYVGQMVWIGDGKPWHLSAVEALGMECLTDSDKRYCKRNSI